MINENKAYVVLSVFAQPIYIKDFHGDSKFMYDKNYGEGVSSVRSIQMNYNTFDFYNIEIESGDKIEWEEIASEDTIIPVYLGERIQRNV